MSIRELLENDGASWKNLYINNLDANVVSNEEYSLNNGNPNEYVKTDVDKNLVTVPSIPASDVTGIENNFLKLDLSNAPLLNPSDQVINVVKAPGATSFGLTGLDYINSTRIYQDTAISDDFILGVGAGANRNVRIEIGQTASCVRIGPWAGERNTLIFGNDAIPLVSKHQSVGIGSLTYNDMVYQVRNSAAPFTWSHGLTASTSQNRMTLTNNTLQFNGGGYSVTNPDSGLTFGTDNTTANNHVIIPSQSNTMMICNATGVPVTAATARLFNVTATTSFSTGFNNTTAAYLCRYAGFKTRTFQVSIQLSLTHSANNTVVTIFISKNGALVASNASAQLTTGTAGTVGQLNLNDQITMNQTDTIQIGLLCSNSGTFTAVFSSITCTALLTI